MTTTEKQIDLKPFCGESGRSEIHKPWVASGHVYATNGYCCVRIVTDEPDSPPPENPKLKRLDSATTLGQWALFGVAEWQSMPETLEDYPRGECDSEVDCNICEACRHWVQCDECKGQGGDDCETCHQWVDCWLCHNNGGQYLIKDGDCEVCKGTRKTWKYVWLGTAKLNRYMVLELAKFPNVEWANAPGCTLFKFDGGQGVLMEVKED